jgi:putative transposase
MLAVHPGGIKGPHIVRFLNALRRHRRKRVILVWDGLPAHRSARVQQALQKHRSWLATVRLPAYAPELNPVEPLWDHLDDTALANTPIDDLSRLRRRVHAAVDHVRHRPALGRGFLKYTGLF